jgi:glycogen debranching enzyme
MKNETLQKAEAILRKNDRGSYTVPTHGLYPFQWNWDSCLSAIGFSHIDEDRAWVEIETLFNHQWEDGMVPHIVFHQHDDGYFPGPSVWQTGRKVDTSGITQPPVAGFAVKRIFERSSNPEKIKSRVLELLPKIHAWHQWFYRCRDPKGSGLVAIIHPWESGRDNSNDWDNALARVPTDGVGSFTRRDTAHADASHRPTQGQYERYIWLVKAFRQHQWDNTTLHDNSPFQMIDPGFNAILIRSCFDLADLADQLGETQMAEESRALGAHALAALESLWSDKWGQYLCLDRISNELVESPSIGGLIPVFTNIPMARAQAIAAKLDELHQLCSYGIPSHHPLSEDFDSKRYWKGPVWLIINYLIADGLRKYGLTARVERITSDSIKLIHQSGFAEYYSPLDGEPCGGLDFTWTAAMVFEFINSFAAEQ